ncbi:MAG: hypothetical protein GQ534_08980 [Candidatus Delongbacteria bacterium]|nr:hypothetical protein [Candidatus Delongbacteria bacterium]
MSNNVIEGTEVTLGQIFVDSSGYFIVAILCAFAGYSLSSGGTYSVKSFFIIGYCVLLLLPYYISREALLERKDPKYSKVVRNQGVQYPIFILILIIPLVYLLLDALFFKYPNDPPTLFWDVILAFSIIMCSFLFLWYDSYRLVKLNKYDRAYMFPSKVLFPAIFTCLLLFSFGWSIYGKSVNLKLIIASSLLVITVKFISINLKLSLLQIAIFILVLLVALVAIVNFFEVEILKPILYGMIIALSLGVSETQKRAYLTQEKDCYYPKLEDRDYLFSVANWGSIVFPLFLAIIPLFSKDLPLWPILIFISVQMSHWFNIDKPNLTRKNYSQSLFIGYALLLLLIGIANSPWPIPITLVHKAPSSTALLISTVIAIGGLIAKLKDKGSWSFKYNISAYREYFNRYVLFVWSLAVLNVLSIVFLYFAEAFALDAIEVIQKKVTEIIGFSFLMLVIVTFIYFRKNEDNDSSNTSTSTGSEDSSIEENTETNNIDNMTKLTCLLKTTRLQTSIIPGIAVFLIAYFSADIYLFESLLGGLIFTLITMFGFLVNDILDYKKDKIAGIDRPIAKGLLDPVHAMFYALLISIVIIVLSHYSGNSIANNIVLGTLFTLICYSYISKFIPLIKGMVTALLCVSPIAYASSIADYRLAHILYFATFILIFGREIMKDGIDYEGDSKSGIKTLPAYLGVKGSKLFGWMIMLVGSFLFIINKSDVALVITSLPIFILLVGFLLSRQNDKIGVKMSRIVLLIYAITIPFLI